MSEIRAEINREATSLPVMHIVKLMHIQVNNFQFRLNNEMIIKVIYTDINYNEFERR